MSDRFKNVPIDDDTKILVSLPARFGEFEVLYQKWCWDGIAAESLILVACDVLDKTDAELETEIRESPLVKPNSQVTIKRAASGYTFVNFNFSA